MSDTQQNGSAPLSSATNFDLPSLYLLRPEIEVALKDAETHLSEFNDDVEQAPLLLDSIDVLTQLTAVLDLISLTGASNLSGLIAESLQALYDAGDNTNDDLILDISESIMILSRYIEFVLLRETLVPVLLLDVINRLNSALGHEQMDESVFDKKEQANISIVNPEQNYQALQDFDIDTPMLSAVYRAGLQVALMSDGIDITINEKRKLVAMNTACSIAAEVTNSLFWRSAEAVTQDIEKILPLSIAQKRTLIFLEQQFQNHLPANDNRFADLVGFAVLRENHLAKAIEQELAANHLSDEQKTQMKRYLLGPNLELVNQLNELIQDEINAIKNEVDSFGQDDSDEGYDQDLETAIKVSEKLEQLSAVLKVLNLDEAATAMSEAAKEVNAWDEPTPEDFDKLLGAFTRGENAAIYLAKTHTPGVKISPIHNPTISAYQLDTAYETLIIESRKILASIENTLTDYTQNAVYSDNSGNNDDANNLTELPEMINQVAGAIRFLNLDKSAGMLARLARFIANNLVDNSYLKDDSLPVLANIANVLMTVDYELNSLQHSHPVSERAMQVGNVSLGQLLAA